MLTRFLTCCFFLISILNVKIIANTLKTDVIINAEEFGVIPNTFKDMAPQLKAMMEEASKYSNVIIEFKNGRYDVWPEHSPKREYYISNTSSEIEVPSKLKTIGLLFENFESITIHGNDALFVFRGKMTNFAFVHCNNVKMQDVSFDYERPTMSELKIESITDTSIIAKVNPSSTYTLVNNKIQFYGEKWMMKHYHTISVDTALSALYYSNFDPILKSKAEEIEPYRVIFKGDFSKSGYKKRQVLTVRDPIRDQVGAFIGYSKNIHLKNVNMHYMHGLGIVSQFTENITFDKVDVKPRKKTGRIIAAFADCFHFSGCKGEIIIKNCTTSGAHDDAVNIHGTHLKVIKKLTLNKIILKFMHHQTYGFDAFFVGDTLDFVHSKSLQIYGRSTIRDVKKINDRLIQVTLHEPIPKGFKKGDVVENVTWTPSVKIQNNHFSGTNTRGVLLTTRKKSLIENNIFYRTGMHAILIANDASSWYESGAVSDVTIKGNQFIECGYNQVPNNYVINIWPENHESVSNYYVHKNIVIENNVFKPFDTPILKANSIKGLVFKNNLIESTGTFPKLRGGAPSFYFQQCNQVELKLKDNDIELFDSVKTKAMKRKDIKISWDKIE